MGNHVLAWFGAPLLALTTLLGPTATVGDGDCALVWSRLAEWIVQEHDLGVTPETLAELDELAPTLEDCRMPGDDPRIGDSVDRWRDLVFVYFPPGDVERVLCLMERESGGNPSAQNQSSGASGLMQVMPEWADEFGYEPVDLFDPMVNLWIASQIEERHGWSSWSPYLKGACR